MQGTLSQWFPVSCQATGGTGAVRSGYSVTPPSSPGGAPSAVVLAFVAEDRLPHTVYPLRCLRFSTPTWRVRQSLDRPPLGPLPQPATGPIPAFTPALSTPARRSEGAPERSTRRDTGRRARASRPTARVRPAGGDRTAAPHPDHSRPPRVPHAPCAPSRHGRGAGRGGDR